MRSTQSSSSPRALARALCSQISGFFSHRITNALESAADELDAHLCLEEKRDGADTSAEAQEVDTIRVLGRRAPSTFCDALNEDVERALMFARTPRGDRGASPDKRPSRPDDFEVSLLSDDELDLSVLVSTAASRFERRNREALESAVMPVAQTFGDTQAESLRGLIGVFPLINRFSKLLAGVNLSVPTRARLMNAFQFHVLEELGQLYQPLAEAVRGAPARPAPRPVSTPAATANGVPAGVQEPQGLDGWVQLLNQRRSPSAGASPGGSSAEFCGAAAAGGAAGPEPSAPDDAAIGPAASHDELIAALANLRVSAVGAVTTAPDADGSLYDHVVTGLQQQCGLSAAEVPAVDLDVLRLVSLFFETFLSDDELPTALRFLVGRLQLPVLRLALSDGSFFDESDHPARLLIQTLCQVGIGWSSDLVWVERSPGFKEASALIDQILDQPEPTATLFEDAAARLEDIHMARLQKADRVEGRVVELEVGRAKLRAAKLVVQDALNERLARHRCLAPLQRFFADAWSKVLVFVCLRHGCEGEDWHTALGVCDELAEVLTPAASKAESRQRFAQVPNLLERLESRMVEAGIVSADVEQSMEGLYAHVDGLRESEDAWFATAGEMIVEQQEEVIPITLTPAPPPPVADGRHALPDWVHPGVWIRVHDEDDPERYQQVKVAANVADTNEVLLVDERGARWGIWSAPELAAAAAEGRVGPVPQDDVVQKTLDAMIAQLTKGPDSLAQSRYH